jgi:DGQHR domain-containing protein
MGRPPRYHSGKKRGKLAKSRNFKALAIKQGEQTLYSFSLKASELWSFVSISRREEDKDEGYQRVLSTSRTRAVADYILAGNIIPGSITIALDAGTFNNSKGLLHIEAGRDVAWVIDGQHRLAGAHQASEEGVDIELNVIALVDFDEQEQIEQFVTINREGKNVPTSLYLDLLKRLPHVKKPGEVAAERAADIANELRHKKDSIFYGRISVTTSPRLGQQVSMVNFVRKITPYVNPERGLLNVFTLPQQVEIVENYFAGIKKVYPDEWKKSDCIFFKTIGFGALWNVFEDIFKECTMQGEGFRVQDIDEVLQPLQSFDFAQWSSLGTGSKGEIEAAKEFQIDFARSIEKRRTGGAKKQIKLR